MAKTDIGPNNPCKACLFYEHPEPCKKGRGKLHHADGNVYLGEWLDDMRHGQGTLHVADESFYEGQWSQDKQHGNGTACDLTGCEFTSQILRKL